MSEAARNQTALRIGAALLCISGWLALMPVGMAALLFGSPDLSRPFKVWLLIWAPAAFVLALFNAIGGILQVHTPEPRLLSQMAAAAAVCVLTCPFLWFFVRVALDAYG